MPVRSPRPCRRCRSTGAPRSTRIPRSMVTDERRGPARARRGAALLARVAGRRDRRARGVARRRPAPRRARRRRDHRHRRRRHRTRREAVSRVLHRRPQARHAVRHSHLDLRHALERDLDRAAGARHQPRAVDRLHEFHRRHRLRDGPAAGRRGRRAALRRRRRLRDARHDLRLLADARRLDGLQRHAGNGPRGRSMRAATASCSARAPGCTCSNARTGRGPAARTSTRPSRATDRPATPITVCRWIRRACRSSARCAWRWTAPAAPAESIGYVNFHGTSTQLNDAIEIRCVRAVFDAHADRLCGSSTKSMVGHPQGASGACGIVTTALAIDRGFLPPTINVARLDPGVRHGRASQRGARRRRSRRRCATALASDRRTAPSWWAARDSDGRCRHRRAVVRPGAFAAIRAGARRGTGGAARSRCRSRVTSCVATRSIPVAWRCCVRRDLPGPIEAHGLPLDGMLVTGATGVCIRGTYGEGLVGRAWARRHLDLHLLEAAAPRRRGRPDVGAGARAVAGRRWPGRRRRAMCVSRTAMRRRSRRGGRSPPTGAARRWRSRWASSAIRVQPRRWAIGTYAEGVEGVGRFGEMHVRAGHYIGVAPAEDGPDEPVPGHVARRPDGRPGGRLWQAIRHDPLLRERCARARQVAPVVTLGPLAVDARAVRRAGPAACRRRGRVRRPDDRRWPAPRVARRAVGGRRAARHAGDVDDEVIARLRRHAAGRLRRQAPLQSRAADAGGLADGCAPRRASARTPGSGAPAAGHRHRGRRGRRAPPGLRGMSRPSRPVAADGAAGGVRHDGARGVAVRGQ